MKVKLFCLPFAGGSAVIYFQWKKYLNANIELIPLELPGRGAKSSQALKHSMQEMVSELYNHIQDKLGRDESYAIFGHSMGSLISFELYHELINNGFKEPVHLFVSAGRAPDRAREKKIHNLPDEEFKQEVLKYSASSSIVFENKEMFDFFVPILRADFEILETYTFQNRERKIECNLTALYGSDDHTVAINEMEQWKSHSSGGWNMHCVQGDHFFAKDQPEQVALLINEAIAGSKCLVAPKA
ncbi:Linear gramicidin dehydrogenase LgrE [compost metagenome]